MNSTNSTSSTSTVTHNLPTTNNNSTSSACSVRWERGSVSVPELRLEAIPDDSPCTSSSILSTGRQWCPSSSSVGVDLCSQHRASSSVGVDLCSQHRASSSAFATPADQFVREIAILKKLCHPNIVRLVEVVDDPTTDNLLLLMEYVEGETLQPSQVCSGSTCRL